MTVDLPTFLYGQVPPHVARRFERAHPLAAKSPAQSQRYSLTGQGIANAVDDMLYIQVFGHPPKTISEAHSMSVTVSRADIRPLDPIPPVVELMPYGGPHNFLGFSVQAPNSPSVQRKKKKEKAKLQDFCKVLDTAMNAALRRSGGFMASAITAADPRDVPRCPSDRAQGLQVRRSCPMIPDARYSFVGRLKFLSPRLRGAAATAHAVDESIYHKVFGDPPEAIPDARCQAIIKTCHYWHINEDDQHSRGEADDQ